MGLTKTTLTSFQKGTGIVLIEEEKLIQTQPMHVQKILHRKEEKEAYLQQARQEAKKQRQALFLEQVKEDDFDVYLDVLSKKKTNIENKIQRTIGIGLVDMLTI